jgi:hypothetical protein
MRRKEGTGLFGQTTRATRNEYGSDSADATFENFSYQSSAISPNTSSPTTTSSSSHIGTMKSNYYQIARQQQQQQQQQQQANSWNLVEVIADMLRYIYTTIVPTPNNNNNNKHEFPQPELSFDATTSSQFEIFKKFAFEKYDTNNSKHESELLDLWNVCMNYKKKKKSNRTELSGRISADWKQIGFQGTNPATDFRGSGILGLDNLLYFAHKYPDKFHSMFTRTRQTSTSYPFVIAGLNVTMLLHDILGIGMHAKKCKNFASRRKFIEMLVNTTDEVDIHTNTNRVKEANLLNFDDATTTTTTANKKQTFKKFKYVLFHELYVTGFILLDQQWYKMNATSYFNFPQVLEETRAKMEDLIELRFESLENVVSWNSRQ